MILSIAIALFILLFVLPLVLPFALLALPWVAALALVFFLLAHTEATLTFLGGLALFSFAMWAVAMLDDMLDSLFRGKKSKKEVRNEY